MSWFDGWMASPAAHALGWALLHFLWEGTAVALLLAVALWVCRGSRNRYLLACGAMVLMVISFGVTMAMNWPAALPQHAAPVRAQAARALPLPEVPDTGVETPPHFAPPRWFVPVWLGGVSLFYLYSLVAWLAATRLKARGTFAAPRCWQERLECLARDLRLRRTITLLESCLTEVPVVIGYFRPVILLPLGLLSGLAPEQVEAVLIHELAHIRRYDYLVNLMQTLVEGLLFYHPAVWWVGSVMRGEREHCCDDVVVALQGDARGYAVTLARLELNRGAVREPALAATGGNLMKRVHRLIEQPEGPRIAAPLVSATLLIAAASLALAAWQPAPQPQPAPAPTPAAAAVPAPAPQQLPQQQPTPMPKKQRVGGSPSLETPYMKWLSEDVAYIISDAERANFKSLTTDPDREKFIEQFWLSRDPTPGTVANEFKEEHYRRIAYANEHFSSSIPGWKTDRGRIYITYGPPNEIDDHSSGGSYIAAGGTTVNTVPFQQWRYRWIDGIGNNVIIEFIDPNRNNEYRMTMDPSEKSDLLARQHTLPITVNVETVPLPFVENLAQTTEVQAKQVSITVPLISLGKNRVIGRVTTPAGRMVASYQDVLDGAKGSGTAHFKLVPGSYQVSVVVTDVATGTSQQGETTVVVQ